MVGSHHSAVSGRGVAAGALLLVLLLGVVIVLAMYALPLGGGGGAGGGGAGGGGGGAAGTSYLDTIARSKHMGEESHVVQTAEAIATDLVAYMLQNNRYPATIEELSAFTGTTYTDPWDDPLRLVIEQPRGGRATFIISSRGNDGQWDSEDDIVVEKPAPL